MAAHQDSPGDSRAFRPPKALPEPPQARPSSPECYFHPTRTTTPGQPRLDTRTHWRSLSAGRKALIIAFLSSLTFLVIVVAAAAGSGSPGPSGSPSPSALATGVAQAAGVASAATSNPAPTHRHRKHHRRRHHHVVASPAPAPIPTGCYPTRRQATVTSLVSSAHRPMPA